jgi:hypothetical protein
VALGAQGIVLELDPSDETLAPDGGRPPRVIGRFMTFDNKRWMIANCDDLPPAERYPTVFCNPSRRSISRNMTVLLLRRRTPYHFGGGCAGQGGGVLE